MAAFMMTSKDPKEDRVVGIKLEVSPEILPRDTSLGTKIFMLVPNEARNVREVKSYISNCVLKTPVPFQFFMGDYRIREEEDAQIFSIISEPCRLAPIPPPRSALSSTPKPKSSEKRVTFFDGDLSTSPVHAHYVNGFDIMDYSHHAGRDIHSPEELALAASSSIKTETGNEEANNDQELDLSDSSTERKKRRRRRHRNKKSKGSADENGQDLNDSALNGSETAHQRNGCALDSAEDNVPEVDSHSSGNADKSQLEVLNEETESEDETAGGSSLPPKEFEFVTPTTTCPNKPLTKMYPDRKRPGGETSEPSDSTFVSPITCPTNKPRVRLYPDRKLPGSKKPKLSDSAFESPGSFLSPAYDSACDSGKPRQDTPIVPRVIKNPKMYNSARKIIDVFTAGQITTDEGNHSDEPESNSRITGKKDHVPASTAVRDDEDGYKSMRLINSIEEVNVGDHVAFKVLELDERYNPSISAYKEGIVSEKTGTQLLITFTKNNTVVRTGRYDIDLGDDKDLKGKDAKLETVELHFAELLEPKFMSQLQVFSTTSTAVRPIAPAGPLVEGNGYSSPPSII